MQTVSSHQATVLPCGSCAWLRRTFPVRHQTSLSCPCRPSPFRPVLPLQLLPQPPEQVRPVLRASVRQTLRPSVLALLRLQQHDGSDQRYRRPDVRYRRLMPQTQLSSDRPWCQSSGPCQRHFPSAVWCPSWPWQQRAYRLQNYPNLRSARPVKNPAWAAWPETPSPSARAAVQT